MSSSANGQYGGAKFVVVGSHIDNVRDQTTIFQTASECNESYICKSALAAISNASGIPVDKAVTALALLATTKDGEGTFMNINLPAGYSYCSSSMSLTSIVPRDGPEGSTFLGRADATGLYSETWTPNQVFGGGRSWVEGDLTVVGVSSASAQAAYASGECHAPNSRIVFYCRGSGCEGGALDRGQALDASTRPGAGSRK
jgi:hypothetical protein